MFCNINAKEIGGLICVLHKHRVFRRSTKINAHAQCIKLTVNQHTVFLMTFQKANRTWRVIFSKVFYFFIASLHDLKIKHWKESKYQMRFRLRSNEWARDKHTHIHTHTHTHTYTHRHTHTHTHTYTYTHTYTETYTHRHTDIHTQRHTHTEIWRE